MENYIRNYVNRKTCLNYSNYNIKTNTKQKKIIEYTIPNKYFCTDLLDKIEEPLLYSIVWIFLNWLLYLFIELIPNITWCSIILSACTIIMCSLFVCLTSCDEFRNTISIVINFLISLIDSLISLILASIVLKWSTGTENEVFKFLINHLLW